MFLEEKSYNQFVMLHNAPVEPTMYFYKPYRFYILIRDETHLPSVKFIKNVLKCSENTEP